MLQYKKNLSTNPDLFTMAQFNRIESTVPSPSQAHSSVSAARRLMFLRLMSVGMAVMLLAVSCSQESPDEWIELEPWGVEVSIVEGPPISFVVRNGPEPTYSAQTPLENMVVPELTVETLELLDAAIKACNTDDGTLLDLSGCAPAAWRACYSAWNSLNGLERSRDAGVRALRKATSRLCNAALYADIAEFRGVIADRFPGHFYSEASENPFYRLAGIWMHQGLSDGFGNYRGGLSVVVFDKLIDFWQAVINYTRLSPDRDDERSFIESILNRHASTGRDSSFSINPLPADSEPNQVEQYCRNARRAAREEHHRWQDLIQNCLDASQACTTATSDSNIICSDVTILTQKEAAWQVLPEICATNEDHIFRSTSDCYKAVEKYCQHHIPKHFYENENYIEKYLGDYFHFLTHWDTCDTIGQ